MAQQIIVGLIVLAAVVYSAWSLMPAAWKKGAAARLASRVRRWGVDEEKAMRLQQSLGAAGSCSECSSCKGCAPAAMPARDPVVALPRSRRQSGVERS